MQRYHWLALCLAGTALGSGLLARTGHPPQLRNAGLRWADLESACLTGADLRGADLRLAHLKAADLRGADLRGANLQGAFAGDADLCRANLSGANLQAVDFAAARLHDADLRGARYDEDTVWPPGLDPQSRGAIQHPITDRQLFRDSLIVRPEWLPRSTDGSIARP